MYFRYFFIFFLLFPLCVQAQMKKGMKFFDTGHYKESLLYFNSVKNPEQNKSLLLARLVAYFETNQLEKAKKDVSLLLNFKNSPDELYYWIGRIFQAEGDYEKAAGYFKQYLKLLSRSNDQRAEIIYRIKQCGHAIRLKYLEPLAFVDNYGKDLNTEFDDFGMLQSPNHSEKFYFSSNREGSTGGKRDESGRVDAIYGHYANDMYKIERKNGNWSSVEPIKSFLNTASDEMILDFSYGGNAMVFVKGPNKYQGRIYVDTFTNKELRLTKKPLQLPIYPEKGDVYFQFYNDSTIVFSSNRLGGYGGFDLYITAYRNGRWLLPKNLGSTINSKYNEITPFLSNDGSLLYFSSNREESLGGYDVFSAKYSSEEKKFKSSKNLGIPINSPMDDLYFYLSKDGMSANFSSDRKESIGQLDLYVAYFKKQITEQQGLAPELPYLFDMYESVIGDKISGEFVPKSVDIKESSNNNLPAERKEEAKEEIVEKKSQEITKDEEKELILEYVIHPYYYQSVGPIVNNKNEGKLKLIIDILKKIPESQLIIHANTLKEGVATYDLYFTMKRGEELLNYFKDRKVDVSRIQMRSNGSNYPLVKTSSSAPSTLAQKLNRRMEFQIIIPKETSSKYHIYYNKPYVVDNLQDSKYDEYKETSNGLSYRILLANTSQMFQNQALNVMDHPMIQKQGTGNDYAYYIGLYKEYKKASRALSKVESYELDNLKIIPFINNVRISRDEVINYAKDYPDLINYIQYYGK